MTLLVRNDPRLAGQVIRYHTWPHIRQQSVGEHSWQVARILMSISDGEFLDILLPYAILHDIGEIAVGDPPYPVKIDNPELGDLYRKAEEKAVQEICEDWMLSPIKLEDPILKWIFKLAEFIEMWEWGMEEKLRGNKFAELVAYRCLKVADEMISQRFDTSISLKASQYISLRAKEWGM